MGGYVINLEKRTIGNSKFREVLHTTSRSQLVVMSLKPGEDIGMEVHDDVDQFLRIETGEGKAILDGKEYPLEDGTAVVVPAGVKHNFINTSKNMAFTSTASSPLPACCSKRTAASRRISLNRRVTSVSDIVCDPGPVLMCRDRIISADKNHGVSGCSSGKVHRPRIG